MVDYKNGKIYTVNLGEEVLYVGSTAQTLARRWGGHHMRAPGRVIKLHENFPCTSKFELTAREEEVRLALRPAYNKRACWTGIPSGLCTTACRKDYDTHPIRRLIKNLYAASHRTEHRARGARTVVCDCGQTLRSDNRGRHKKRPPHMKRMVAGLVRTNLARRVWLAKTNNAA